MSKGPTVHLCRYLANSFFHFPLLFGKVQLAFARRLLISLAWKFRFCRFFIFVTIIFIIMFCLRNICQLALELAGVRLSYPTAVIIYHEPHYKRVLWAALGPRSILKTRYGWVHKLRHDSKGLMPLNSNMIIISSIFSINTFTFSFYLESHIYNQNADS